LKIEGNSNFLKKFFTARMVPIGKDILLLGVSAEALVFDCFVAINQFDSRAHIIFTVKLGVKRESRGYTIWNNLCFVIQYFG